MWGNFDGARDIVASEVLTSTLQRYRVALDEPAAQQPPSLPGHRVQPPLVNACVLLKLLCSNLAAGAIIGREGCNRDVLMAISGARVQLSRPNEFYPGTEDRVLVLTGTLPACLTAIFVCAVKLIGGVDKLPIQVLNAGGVTHFKLLLPRRVCGYLIGPGGQTIRAMCVESGAELYVSEVEDDEEGGAAAGGSYRRGRRAPPLEPGVPELEERQLTVRGGIVQCLKGIGLVMHQLLLRPYVEPDAMPFVGQFPHGRLTLTAMTGWVPNPPSGLFQVPSYLVQHLLFNMPHPLQHPTLGQIHLQQPSLQEGPLPHAQQQQQQAQGHQPQSQPLHYQAASMLAPGAGTALYPPPGSAAAPGARALYYVPFQAAPAPFVPLAAAALPTVSQPMAIPPLPSVALGDITAATMPVAAPSALGMGALGTMLRGEGVSGGASLPGVGGEPEGPGGPAGAPGVPDVPPGVVQPEGADHYLEVELLVSDSRVGKLLGPRGETLSQLRNIMGCNVQIHPRTAQAFQRRVTLSGRASGVRLAQQSILLRLGADSVTVVPQTPVGEGVGGGGGGPEEGLLHQAPSLVGPGSGGGGPGAPRGSQGGVRRHGDEGGAGPSGLFHSGAGGRGGGGGGYRSAGFRAAPEGGERAGPGGSPSQPPGRPESVRGHSGSGSASTRGSRG